MNINEYVPAFEAVIFASGEPIHMDKLADVFNIDKPTALKILKILSDRLDDSGSGIKLLRLGDSFQLCTRTEYSVYIRNALNISRKTPLSQAAFEVLAVIAYNQPVTRAFVEQVRGVDCSGVISTLVEKELIEEKGRLDLPGKPLLYGTTDVFLRCFGLSSLDELPPLPINNNEGIEGTTLIEKF
ncbi:MAG TPA: SMC-Scp complex subunit ScpB [Clostridiales bacterium]|nr:SMC-Scp complex subunit ScpB [Clostridiales bacterium]